MSKPQKYNPFSVANETRCGDCNKVLTNADGSKPEDTYISEYGVQCPDCYRLERAAEVKARQERAEQNGICPACVRLLPESPLLWRRLNPVKVRNSLSRRDNKTYICNVCGGAEAMADYMNVTDVEARAAVEVRLRQ